MNVSLVAFPSSQNPLQISGTLSVQFTAADIANRTSGHATAAIGLEVTVGIGGSVDPSLIYSLFPTGQPSGAYAANGGPAVPPNQQLTGSAQVLFTYQFTGVPVPNSTVTETLRWDGVNGVGILTAPFTLQPPPTRPGPAAGSI